MSVNVISSPVAVDFKDVGAVPAVHADRFEQLVLDLKRALGPSSGLTSDDVDVEMLKQLMQEYQSSDRNWLRYAYGDSSRGYTRNLVDEGNGKSNLVSHSHATAPRWAATNSDVARAGLDSW
jgi:hypothetical protein